MSNPFDTPNPPNPTKVADAQSAANVETAVAQAGLNNVNQVTPYGNLTYSQSGTWGDGTPQYTATQTLSPEQQALYAQNAQNQQAASNLAGSQLQNISGALNPLTLGATPQQAGINLNNNLGLNSNLGLNQNLGNNTNLSYENSPSLSNDAMLNQITSLQTGFLDPQWAKQQQTAESNLINKGIVPGTEAYNNAMEQFNLSKSQAYNDMFLGAQNQVFGQQAQAKQLTNAELENSFNAYNQNNQANQNFANQNNLAQNQFNNQAQLAQGQFNNQATQQMGNFNNTALTNNWQQQVQDAVLQQNQPINQFSALMSGSQVQQPNYVNTPQTGIANTDVAGITQNAYAQQAAQNNAMWGALGGAGASAAYALSDRRAKQDIRRVGELGKGLGVYTWRYKDGFDDGQRHMGFMAQEVDRVLPEAVAETDSGYLAVNNAAVIEALGA